MFKFYNGIINSKVVPISLYEVILITPSNLSSSFLTALIPTPLPDISLTVVLVEKLSLKGKHNLENVMFIVATAKTFGISTDIIKEYLYNTESLEHRMEDFLKVEGVTFINDSKGTNIDSTIKAIEAYLNVKEETKQLTKNLSIARAYSLIANYHKTIEYLNQCKDKETNLDVIHGFIESYENLGDKGKAIKYIKKALEIEPENIEFQEILYSLNK